jgi:hypothetical protein
MSENSKGRSVTELNEFLAYVAKKNLMKPATINSWKASCNQVFSILEDEERKDISLEKLENIFNRFENKCSLKFTASSLQTYKSRVKKAVQEFLEFKNNPATWKPSLSQRPGKSNKSKNQADINDDSESVLNEQADGENISDKNNREILSHKFPLREGSTINILGVPRDLKLIEAKRIGAFLATLCEDFKPGEF